MPPTKAARFPDCSMAAGRRCGVRNPTRHVFWVKAVVGSMLAPKATRSWRRRFTAVPLVRVVAQVAAHRDRLAADVLAGIAGEQKRGVGDVLRAHRAAHADALEHLR